jgi:hypothetical protein
MAVMAAAVMVTAIGAPALATATTRPHPVDNRPAEAATVQSSDSTQVTTPGRPTVDRPPATDERPTVRDRCAVDPQPRRCPDRPDDVNIRHLIWRLVKAGEWRKLFHLLHRLGII